MFKGFEELTAEEVADKIKVDISSGDDKISITNAAVVDVTLPADRTTPGSFNVEYELRVNPAAFPEGIHTSFGFRSNC